MILLPHWTVIYNTEEGVSLLAQADNRLLRDRAERKDAALGLHRHDPIHPVGYADFGQQRNLHQHDSSLPAALQAGDPALEPREDDGMHE